MPDTPVSLLERLRARPTDDAWKQLVDLYSTLLYSWLQRQAVQSADADDVIQEVFRVVVGRMAEFQHNQQAGAFRTWLRQIMVNCLGNFRRKHPDRSGESWQKLEQLADPQSELTRLWEQEHNQHVAQYFLQEVERKFEPATCLAFRGVVVEGKKTATVAAELGVSVNAVRLAKSHVLRWLREASQGLLE